MEPSLDQIDDYNGNESPQKKKIVTFVVVALLALGLGYTMIKNSADSGMPNDFIPYDRQ